jgi:hypothetical protein
MTNQRVYKRVFRPETNTTVILIKLVLPVFLLVLGAFTILLITYTRGSVETVNADNDLTFAFNFLPYTITSQAEKLNKVQSSTYQFNSSAKLTDKRGYLFDMYFKDNNSPLYGTGDLFALACDAYGAPRDCVTVVAIAKHETDLCKYKNSFEMNNCWGWGGGGEYRQSFKDIGEGIWTVTRVLVQQYGQRYMLDPRLMERVFCGPDPECANWGYRVLSLMTELRTYAKNKGIALE